MKKKTAKTKNPNESIIKLSTIIGRANQIVQSKENPFNAFDVSMVVGAVVGLPKEYVLNQMLKEK